MKHSFDATYYFETLMNDGFFDEVMDSMHWSDSFNTETLLQIGLKEAAADEIELTGLDSFDYDTFFYNAYQCTEKGLS